jgi:hypothetical protein
MPKLKRTKACKECPFRRTSAPGWLGAEKDPQAFVRAAEADYVDNPLPCHMAIDYSDDDWRGEQYDNADLCAGALIYARNQCKVPRDPERAMDVAGVEEDRKNIFEYPHEFVEHHGGELTEIQAFIKRNLES